MRFLFAAIVASFCVGSPALAVMIETVPVGSAGNAADTTGFGAVNYDYRIGTYEVTNSQYVEFLNAVDPTGANPLDLWNPNMGFNDIFLNRGAVDGSKYGLVENPLGVSRGQHPVVHVSWFDAVRFANWLHNGQGSGDTETGAYTLSDGPFITRNTGATWFVTSEDEWYKAAYHKNDGATGNYFEYPTSSDTTPVFEFPPGGSNSANYALHAGTSDVGAYIASDSPYGTFDQGGNAWEWTEDFFGSAGNRGWRGGSFRSSSDHLQASTRVGVLLIYELDDVGFRVATIPEPSTVILSAIGLVGLFVLGTRSRRC